MIIQYPLNNSNSMFGLYSHKLPNCCHVNHQKFKTPFTWNKVFTPAKLSSKWPKLIIVLSSLIRAFVVPNIQTITTCKSVKQQPYSTQKQSKKNFQNNFLTNPTIRVEIKLPHDSGACQKYQVIWKKFPLEWQEKDRHF